MRKMMEKMESGCLAHRDDAFVTIARTDALVVEGIEGTVRSVRAYADAGADVIVPDAMKTEDDIKRPIDGAGIL